MVDKRTSDKITSLGLVCAVLVTYIHVMLLNGASVGSMGWWTWALFTSGICSIAVPFFFAVSGFFLASRMDDVAWWRTALCKRIKSLFVPYVFWSVTVTGLIFAVMSVLPPHFFEAVSMPGGLARWHRCPNLHDLLWNPPLYPFWYIRMLLCLIVISPVIKWMVERAGVSVIVALFCLCLTLDCYAARLPSFLTTLLMTTFPVRGTLYFVIGVWIQLQGRSFNITRSNALTALGLGISGFILRAIVLYFGHVAFAASCLTLAVPLALLGIFTLWPPVTLPKMLAQASFPVFVLHTHMLLAVELIFLGWLQLPFRGNVAGYAIEGMLAVLASVMFAAPIRTFAAWSFGGR